MQQNGMDEQNPSNPLQKKQYRKCKTDLFNQAQKCVRNFTRKVDPQVTLHGSFANGTQSYDSDIDLITPTPLYTIFTQIQNMRKGDYSVLNYIENAKIKRLVLFDSYQGFQLDLVNISERSQLLKDQIVQKLVEWDDLVLKCVQRLKKWRKQQEFLLVAAKGQPNNYILQIVLFYVMMKLNLLPYLDPAGALDLTGFRKSRDLTVNQVVNNFMRFISKTDNREVVDLRARKPRFSVEAWEILDPSTNLPFKTMTGEVPQWVCFCAQNYLKQRSFDESYQQINRTIFCSEEHQFHPKNDTKRENNQDTQQCQAQGQAVTDYGTDLTIGKDLHYHELNSLQTVGEQFDIRDCMLDYLEVANAIQVDFQEELQPCEIDLGQEGSTEYLPQFSKDDNKSDAGQSNASEKFSSESTDCPKHFEGKENNKENQIRPKFNDLIQCKEFKAK